MHIYLCILACMIYKHKYTYIMTKLLMVMMGVGRVTDVKRICAKWWWFFSRLFVAVNSSLFLLLIISESVCVSVCMSVCLSVCLSVLTVLWKEPFVDLTVLYCIVCTNFDSTGYKDIHIMIFCLAVPMCKIEKYYVALLIFW